MLQRLRKLVRQASLEGDSARLSIVTSVVILELDNGTSDGVGITIRVGVGGEPLSIVSETEVDLLGIKSHVQVLVDTIQGALDACLVGSDIVTTVHKIVAHNVDHIDGFPDLGAGLLGESDHVLLASWDGDGESLVTNRFADFGKELGVGLDFGDLVLVGDLFVCLAIATGVFPVNVCLR